MFPIIFGAPTFVSTLLGGLFAVGLRIIHLEFWQERGAVNTVEKL